MGKLRNMWKRRYETAETGNQLFMQEHEFQNL